MLQGKLIYDADGKLISHRIWFKVILNPILRKLFHKHIVTHLNEDNIVVGYELKKYKKDKIL